MCIFCLFFGEKLTVTKALAVVLAFGGVFFLSGASLGGDFTLNPLGLLFVLVTIFTYGSYIIGVNNKIIQSNIQMFGQKVEKVD